MSVTVRQPLLPQDVYRYPDTSVCRRPMSAAVSVPVPVSGDAFIHPFQSSSGFKCALTSVPVRQPIPPPAVPDAVPAPVVPAAITIPSGRGWF